MLLFFSGFHPVLCCWSLDLEPSLFRLTRGGTCLQRRLCTTVFFVGVICVRVVDIWNLLLACASHQWRTVCTMSQQGWQLDPPSTSTPSPFLFDQDIACCVTSRRTTRHHGCFMQSNDWRTPQAMFEIAQTNELYPFCVQYSNVGGGKTVPPQTCKECSTKSSNRHAMLACSFPRTFTKWIDSTRARFLYLHLQPTITSCTYCHFTPPPPRLPPHHTLLLENTYTPVPSRRYISSSLHAHDLNNIYLVLLYIFAHSIVLCFLYICIRCLGDVFTLPPLPPRPPPPLLLLVQNGLRTKLGEVVDLYVLSLIPTRNSIQYDYFVLNRRSWLTSRSEQESHKFKSFFTEKYVVQDV